VHDLTAACRWADHIVAVSAGRVVAEGRPVDVVTPDLVRSLYGVEAVVVADPVAGCPVVVPLRLAS
jgi:iron complex transport system ATP-binding protein